MSDEADFKRLAEKIHEDFAFAAPEIWTLHLARRLQDAAELIAPLDAAWADAKAAAGPGALITLGERDTTVEAYAKRGTEALGFGYGPTTVAALRALTDKIERDKAESDGI